MMASSRPAAQPGRKLLILMKGIAAGLLLLLVFIASAVADAVISFTPGAPQLGEVVDVSVLPSREGAIAVRYDLQTPSGVVFSGDETTHFTASFRPREQAVYTLTVTVVYGKQDLETASVSIPVSGVAPVQEGNDVVYSQKDGWWRSVLYRSKKPVETLEKGGCAIFSLSHILQRLGFSGSEVLPDALAARYTRFYIPGRGTDNPGLITRSAGDFGFLTQDDLIETERGILTALRRGDLLTFSVVIGHIAMADGVSEDGTKVHVVDSAPGATYERINRFKTKGHIFYQQEDGTFVEALSPDELPGARWFFETGEYGGLSYWLDLPYCAYRGMRLVRLPWLFAETESGSQPVSLEYTGTLVSKVVLNGESCRLPSRDLSWSTSGADQPLVALITRKGGTGFLDGDGKKLKRFSKKISRGTMLAVLGLEDDLCYVCWKNTFGYIARKDVDLLPVCQDSFASGVISVNGRTSGTATVIARADPSSRSDKVAEWKIGSLAAVLEKSGDYYLVEARGARGWVHEKYLTLNASETETAAE